MLSELGATRSSPRPRGQQEGRWLRQQCEPPPFLTRCFQVTPLLGLPTQSRRVCVPGSKASCPQPLSSPCQCFLAPPPLLPVPSLSCSHCPCTPCLSLLGMPPACLLVIFVGLTHSLRGPALVRGCFSHRSEGKEGRPWSKSQKPPPRAGHCQLWATERLWWVRATGLGTPGHRSAGNHCPL